MQKSTNSVSWVLVNESTKYQFYNLVVTVPGGTTYLVGTVTGHRTYKLGRLLEEADFGSASFRNTLYRNNLWSFEVLHGGDTVPHFSMGSASGAIGNVQKLIERARPLNKFKV